MAGAELNQRQLAEILGVSQVSVSDWLKNKNSPGINALTKIAEYFNTTVDFLIKEDPDLDQYPGLALNHIRKKEEETDLEAELFRELEGLPDQMAEEMREMAESYRLKLLERVKDIEKEIVKKRIKETP